MSEAVVDFFRQLSNSDFVIGVARESGHNVFAAASVMLASHRPPMLAVCVDRRHPGYPLMRAGRIFSVSVVRKIPPQLVHRLGTRASRDGGAPILDEGVLAHFECEINALVSAGDHEILLGRIVDNHLPAEPLRHLPQPEFAERRLRDRHTAAQAMPST